MPLLHDCKSRFESKLTIGGVLIPVLLVKLPLLLVKQYYIRSHKRRGYI
jgi:hypothetical protein